MYIREMCDRLKQEDANILGRASFLFWRYFWWVYFHEIIGHGLGHRFRVKGYSSKKPKHFDDWVTVFTDTFLEVWASGFSVDEIKTIPLAEDLGIL